MKKNKNKTAKLPRDWNAVDAHFRKSGYMRDRREERGGSRNLVRDHLDEYYYDQELEYCGDSECSNNYHSDDCDVGNDDV